MDRLMGVFRLIVITGLLTPWLAAQETPISRIETLGQATVYAPPSHVEFWLHFQARDASMELAMKGIHEFEGKLQAKVNEAQIQSGAFEISAPAVPDVRENRVVITAVLRVPMTGFMNPETGAGEFARLCDKVAAIARDLECEITGPTLDTTERQALQQSALSTATEYAYPAAESIAKTLNSSIWAVETVQVLEVLWNQPLEFQGVEPTIRQLSCTAKVRVTYALRGGQG
ncbi:MAG: hypothetical protein HYV26_13225 [Candidatus Hydrogenedentes bacterium]|nr:hypothetical protein [Candidatus Hydrogenedentota bacterium]